MVCCFIDHSSLGVHKCNTHWCIALIYTLTLKLEEIYCLQPGCAWCKLVPYKHSQAVNKGTVLKSLGKKCFEISGDVQKMAAMMLILLNFNNAHSHY